MITRTVLAVAIGVWTLLSWGGRIRLLTQSEQDLGNWLRIGGSLLVGAAAVVVLAATGGGGLQRWVLTLFAAWSVGIWLRSLVSVWSGEQSLAFKAVHTVLAAGFFVLSYFSLRRGWGN
ncbi:MAG: hypothetical protein ACLFWM_07200 [Actinomycetota bacterium]